MPKQTAQNKYYSVAKPLDKEVMLRYAVSRMSDGIKNGDVAKELSEKFRIKQHDSLKIIEDCKSVIKNQLQIRVPFILSSHIERYEILYRKFEIIDRTDLMTKCLSQKEELLSLKNALTERLQEDFNSKEIENKFNLKALSVEKQMRVRDLIEKGIKS